jgi:Zn-finger protein
MNELRERTLLELFRALDGIYGSNYECKYYPCHFHGQDCTFCYCPFYPCLIYDLGGEIVLTEDGYRWSCKGCFWIHERDKAEEVIIRLGSYPKQRLVEENWLFFNRTLQTIYYGEERGVMLENCYNLMPAVLSSKECEEIDDVEFLAVRVEEFEVLDVRRIKDLNEADEEIVIPLKIGGELYGIDGRGRCVVCKI